jgi:hypothetical protein
MPAIGHPQMMVEAGRVFHQTQPKHWPHVSCMAFVTALHAPFWTCSMLSLSPSALISRPYVDLVNLLLTCGEEVKEAVTHSVQAQCEQNWGGLCSILSFCTSAIQRPPTVPPEHHPVGDRARLSRAHHGDTGHHFSDPSSREASRGTKGERGNKSHPNAHARGRAGGHGTQGPSGSSEWEDEQSEYSDIRR